MKHQNSYKKQLKNILAIKNGNSLTEKVSSILNIPISNDWSIIDTQDSLCLVHYSDDADMEQFGHLRGVVVDIDQKRVIAPSYFGYNPEAVTDSITLIDNYVNITDNCEVDHKFNIDNMYIKPVFDGVVIRVIWYNSKAYFISHSKIDISRSRWGSCKTTFMDMYKEAEGPSVDDLFDTTQSESSTCYTFIIVHQLLTVGTRQIVNKPYIVCLSQESSINEFPSGKMTFKDIELKYQIDKSFIGKSPLLNLDQANYHLKYGYHDKFDITCDPRSYPGESVIIYSLKDGQVNDIVRVHSSGYEWRKEMRGNNPNIRHQFYKLMSDIYYPVESELDMEYLKSRYMMFDFSFDFQDKVIMTGAKELTYQIVKDNKQFLLSLICANYIYSLPLNKRELCVNIISELIDDRKLVIDWLKNLDPSKSRDVSYRANNIIMSARLLAKERIEKGNNRSKSGKKLSYNQLVNIGIYNFIQREKGESLYSLIREMKKSTETVK